MSRSIIVLLAVLFSLNTYAQFQLSGEFTPRTEASHGYGKLAAENQDLSVFTAQRTRLNADYKGDKVLVGLVLQDVRLWGGQPQLVTNEDYSMSVHQAWAEVFLAESFSLKAGRQELVYDDHRILGNVGWALQARSHDLALFKYEKGFKLHVGIAHNENMNRTNSLFEGPDAYKNMQFVWYNRSMKDLNMSLLFLNNGAVNNYLADQEVNYSQIIGTHLALKEDKWKFAANAYLQTGKLASGSKVNAYNLLLEAASPAGISAGFERLSGTSYDDTEIKSFTPLYGTNHKFNGFMDYFYVGNHMNTVGLDDIYLKYAYTKDAFGFSAHLHYFSAAAELAPTTDKYLGTELDLVFDWKISSIAKLSAGWSSMFAGDSMELLKGGSSSATNYWSWIMLSVTPKFIN